jgi:hypothetical protein
MQYLQNLLKLVDQDVAHFFASSENFLGRLLVHILIIVVEPAILFFSIHVALVVSRVRGGSIVIDDCTQSV